jgi:hypothetical protein
MAIPRKGSRVLDVDGRQFRYLVKNPGFGELTVTVQEDIRPSGRVMQFGWPDGHPVVPSDVEYVVRASLAHGWDPTKSGPAFRGGHPKASTIDNDE